MVRRRFSGGPWDGQDFDVPDLTVFRVLIQVEPHWEDGGNEPKRPFRYGIYERATAADSTVIYVWKGLPDD